jgi:hypothetical protein
VTSGGIPIRGTLNHAVYPQQLLTGFATIWNGTNVAQVSLPQSNVERILTRVVLITTLQQADMVSTTYWDGVQTQAPFYLFAGAPGMSNLQDITLIGNVNVGEWFTPIRIQPNTDFTGIWLGVLAASAPKCLASFYCEVY